MTTASTQRNITLYPWYRFFSGLVFWQSIWFLYIQNELSAAAAITLYAIYDVSTTLLEVPSGYMSDRLGRKRTLIVAAVAGAIAAGLQAYGGSFAIFALGNICLGVSAAFVSGTDSALLYESLNAENRETEVERCELVSWRVSFTALALSAVLGGAMWSIDPRVPYIATTLAFAACLVIAMLFAEPPHSDTSAADTLDPYHLKPLWTALKTPVLMWLFVLSLLMYMFSHIPFVFGQPFILEALDGVGLAADAPLISGAVTATMMGLSVVVSLFALQVRYRIGLAAILLLALGIQVALISALAVSNAIWVIALLFLRMVPNSLSGPFILARIQPMLPDDTRATYLSLQSLAGRALFAATLFVSATASSNAGLMPYSEIQSILVWYVVAGVIALAGLALWARKLPLEAPQSTARSK